MMKLYGALILCVTLSAACGLKCYSCAAANSKSCTETTVCAPGFNRCFSATDGLNAVAKGCQNSLTCLPFMTCCEGDLCNSAIPTGPSAIILLVSSAILKFLF
ncbi:unnamed protein product [Oreochromis niloticus]|nr:unnamed protein product [Mustela putorius furo]